MESNFLRIGQRILYKSRVMSSSGSESEGKAPKKAKLGKRSAPSTVEKSTDDKKEEWPLSAQRRVSLMHFKGKVYVDIRETYTDKEGETKPGKKGIALSPEQWAELLKHSEEINEQLAKAK